MTGSGGRLQFGTVAGIKSERWPASNRNPRPDCVGIRKDDDFRPWIVDSDELKPHRMRLARALVLSRDLDLTGLHARILSESFESLWAKVTWPKRLHDGAGT